MKPSKYKAKKTVVNGITFDSKAEAQRYGQLVLMEKAGKIRNLELQPRYLLQDGYVRNGKKVRKIEYVADFRYEERSNQWEPFIIVVEDVKGKATELYKVKLKIFLKLFGHLYEFREIRNGKVFEL